MKKPSIGALVALVLLAILPALATPALAHDALKSSDPAKDAEVETVEEVTLEFTGKVRLPTVVVTDSDGTHHESGKPEVDGQVVTQELKASLPKGKYTIAYRVVSSDGHPIQGEIPFTVTRGPEPSPVPSEESEEDATAEPAEESAAPEDEAAQENAAEGTAQESTAPQQDAAAPASPVSGEDDQGGVPGWLWIAALALAGVGIGVFLSMRGRKPGEER